MRLKSGFVRYVGLMLIAFACERSGSPPTSSSSISQFDTLVTSQSGRIGHLGGVGIDNAGRVWLTDILNNRILVLDSAGAELMRIGRQGSGPGEFRAPWTLAINSSQLFVYDRDNSRLQVFNLDGEYQSAHRVGAPAYVAVGMNERGELALPTLGGSGSLVQIVRPDDEEPVFVGTARERAPSEISLRRIREQIRAGEMPPEFRNNVLPIMHPDGSVTMVVQAEGVIEHFNPDAELEWTRALPEKEVATAMDAFFAGWEGPMPPQTARAGVVVGDEIWLMVDAAEGQGSVILIYDSESGQIRSRRSLELRSRAGLFAVSRGLDQLVVYLPEDASLLSAGLK